MPKPFRFEPNGTKVASKKTLNTKNLEALGTQRLAALLVEVSTANAAVKRRLRLELAGAQSSEEVSKEVRTRLTTAYGSGQHASRRFSRGRRVRWAWEIAEGEDRNEGGENR